MEAGQNAEDKHAACFFVNMMGIQVGISIYGYQSILLYERTCMEMGCLSKSEKYCFTFCSCLY